MSKHPSYAKICVLMWSASASLKQIADRLGQHLDLYYEPGEHFRTRSGRILNATSSDYYLMTKDVVETDHSKVRDRVTSLVQMIEGDSYLTSLLDRGLADVVVSVPFFGNDLIDFEGLHLDLAPFGDRIGLIVYDYSELDYNGRAVRQFKVGRTR